MTVLFHDVKNKPELAADLAANRIPGSKFDAILYADDTILVSTNPAVLQIYLKHIEEEGKK